jgi:hypothetical protein
LQKWHLAVDAVSHEVIAAQTVSIRWVITTTINCHVKL